MAVLAARAERDPQNPAWPLESMRIHARVRDFAPAIEHARRVLALLPAAAGVWLELANLLASAGRTGEVAAAVAPAIALLPDRPHYRLEAARLLMDAGAFEAAQEHAEAAARLGDARGNRMLGQLALWSGQIPETSDPRLAMSVALVRRQWHEAAALATRVLGEDTSCVDAFVVRAESHLHSGRLDAVEADLDRAVEGADAFLPQATLVRLLWASSLGDGRRALGRTPMQEIAEVLEELVPGSRALADRPLVEARAALLDALACMCGNRCTIPTWRSASGLRRISARTSPRHASRRALELIRVAEPARALAELDQVVGRYPESPLPACHRGELHLWLGDAARARADFVGAIEIARETRFAYIGLGGAALLENDPEAALEVLLQGVVIMGSTEGPAVFVYRGEALRKLGRLREARADLERAVASRPSRAGAWINLALACDALGDVAAARAAFERTKAIAPALLEDAGGDLEGALEMLRGNRSSTCLTWFLADGRLRAAPAMRSELVEKP